MLRACVSPKLQIFARLLAQMPSSVFASAQDKPDTHFYQHQKINVHQNPSSICSAIKADEQLCSDAGIPQSGCSCKHNVNAPNSRCCNDNRASCSCPTGSNSKWKYIGQCVFHGQPGCQETDTTTTCNNVS